MGIAKKGDSVVFKAFADADDIPEHGDLLEVGESYEVFKVSEDEGEDTSYFLAVPNPEFDDAKKASKKNPEFVYVNVFEDEIEVSDDEDEDEGEESEEEEGEDEEESEDEGEEEEEAPPAKKKAVAKKAPAKKAATVKKAAPKKAEKAKPAAKKGKKTDEKAAVKPKGRPGRPKKVAEEEEGDPDLKGLTILERDEEDEDILAMIDDGDVLELAKELVSESTVTEYRLGGILYHVRVSKAYKELDATYAETGGFQLYVQEQLGIEYRKAMYLVDIYTKFSKAGIHGDRVGEIGWTKAKEIARIVTEDNADALLEAAAESTVEELKETIRESYTPEGKETRPVTKKVTFKFRLEAEAGEQVQSYLLAAQEHFGHKKLEETFQQIVTEWAVENMNVEVPAEEEQEEEEAPRKTKRTSTKKVAGKKTRATRA